MSLKLWRAAEAAMGTKQASATRSRLPPRLRHLMRALEALEAGDGEAVSALAGELQLTQADISVVLSTVATPPDELEHRRLGTRVKNAQIGADLTLPFADLLRVMAGSIATGKAQGCNASLRAARDSRPGLGQAIHAFTSKAGRASANLDTRAWSPRAEQVFAITHCDRLDYALTPAWARKNFVGEPVVMGAHWPLERWTDTERLVAERLRSAWVHKHDALSERIDEEDHPTRERILQQILRQLGDSVPKGDWRRLTGAVHRAWHLAVDLGLDPLTDQLASLDLRLAWFSGRDPEGLALLWHDERLVHEGRDVAARALTDDRSHPEAELWLLGRTDDLDEVVNLAMEAERVLSVSQLRGAGMSNDRARFAVGCQAVSESRWREAWAQLVALVPQDLALRLAREITLARPADPPRRRDVARVLERFLNGDPGLEGPLALAELTGAARMLSAGHRRQIASRIDSASGWLPLGRALRLCILLQDQDRGSVVVRRLGRLLRGGQISDTAVLTLLTQTPISDELEPGRTLTAPLTAYVSRPGTDLWNTARTVAGAAAEGLVAWYSANTDRVGIDHAWSALIADLVGQVHGCSYAPGEVRAALQHGPLTMPELDEALGPQTTFESIPW